MLGYSAEFAGTEVISIEYGIEDYAILMTGTLGNKPTRHRVKIRCNMKGEPFVLVHGKRLYFKDIMRIA